MQEVDDPQGRRQVWRAHHVDGHHGDERHVGSVEVAIEHGEGYEEGKAAEQRDEQAAQALHAHGEEVAQVTVPLQPPVGREQNIRVSHSQL